MYTATQRITVIGIRSFISIIVICIYLSFFTIPFFKAPIKALIEQGLLSHGVAFQEAALGLNILQNTLELSLAEPQVFDKSGRVVAAAPKIIIDIDIPSLFFGGIEFNHITLVAPKIGVVRNVDRSIKVNIGTSKKVDLVIFDNFYGPIMAALTFPLVSIIDASTSIHDEISGIQIKSMQSSFHLQRSLSKELVQYELEATAKDTRMLLMAKSIYKGADRRTELTFFLDQVQPETFQKLFPYKQYLSFLEMPVSGEGQIFLDKSLAIISTEFNFVGGKGRVELSDYIGSYLNIEGFLLKGETARGLDYLELHQLRLDINGGYAIFNGALDHRDQVLSMDIGIALDGAPLSVFMPKWFSRWEGYLLGNNNADVVMKELRLNSRFDIQTKAIDGQGAIITTSKFNSPDLRLNDQDQTDVRFSFKGTFDDTLVFRKNYVREVSANF